MRFSSTLYLLNDFSFSIYFIPDNFAILASATTEGHVALWDLDKRQLSSVRLLVSDAFHHDVGVRKTQF